MPGNVEAIRFWLNDRRREISDLSPTTTLLQYLRENEGLMGTKEGCAEGDCGACTVALLEHGPAGASYRAVNSCLLFLPMLQGRRVYTVEALRGEQGAMADPARGLHPVQRALVQTRSSQCGYCTPGIAMSMFEACYREDMGEGWQIDDQLCGNLCRCTGYRPIREAAEQVAGARPADRFLAELHHSEPRSGELSYQHGDQRYLQPASLEALWAAMAQAPEAVLVAGGTDVALSVTKRFAHLPAVIGLEAIAEMQVLEASAGGWRVGAGVRLTRVMEEVAPELPALMEMLKVFGSRQIRSRGTLGGNLVNASPIGDMAPVLRALGAEVVLAGASGRRRISLDGFFEGYRRTALRPGEVLLEVWIPRPAPGLQVRSYKVSKRRELDISTVAAGMALALDEGVVRELRLSYGGVSAIAGARASLTEAALVGQPWTLEAVERAAEALERDFSPIDDLRGSAAYRRLLTRNLLIRFFHDTTGSAA